MDWLLVIKTKSGRKERQEKTKTTGKQVKKIANPQNERLVKL